MARALLITADNSLEELVKKSCELLPQAASLRREPTPSEALTKAFEELPDFVLIDWACAEPSEHTRLLQNLRLIPGGRSLPAFVLAASFVPQVLGVGSEYAIARIIPRQVAVDSLAGMIQTVLADRNKDSGQRTFVGRLEAAHDKGATGELDNIVEDFHVTHPDNPRAQIEFAHLCIRRGRFAEALPIAERLFEKQRDNLRVVSLLARVKLHMGEFDTVIGLLEPAETLSPKNLERLVMLGNAYVRKGRNAEARASYEDALEIDPTHKEARQGLGVVELSEGHVNHALELFRDSATEEEIGGFFNNTAILAVRQKRFDQATRLYTAAFEALESPRLKAKVLFNLGLALRKWNKPAQARKCFTDALSFDGNLEKARRHLFEAKLLSAMTDGSSPLESLPSAPQASRLEITEEPATMDNGEKLNDEDEDYF